MSSAKFTTKQVVVSKPVLILYVNDLNTGVVNLEIDCNEVLCLIDDLLDVALKAKNQNVELFCSDSEAMNFWVEQQKQKIDQLKSEL